MVYHIIALVMQGVGVLMLLFATAFYLGFIRETRRADYPSQQNASNLQYVFLFMMYAFIAGYLASIVHIVSTPNLDSIYYLVVTILFMVATFCTLTVKIQIDAVRLLKSRTLSAMQSFINAVDMKDGYTLRHSWQVYRLAGVFFDTLPKKLARSISKEKLLDSAFLHDVGKINIRTELLNKTGPLDDEEWYAIKAHPFNGKRIVDNTCFRDIGDIILYHHERIDGTGYYGLDGDKIPIESRMLAICESYSSMRANRSFAPAKTHAQAIAILKAASGSQFDPELLSYFLRIDPSTFAKIIEEA